MVSRVGPHTAMAAAPGTQYSGLANLMAMQGTGGDNTLVHMSKAELPYLNTLARAAGHTNGLPINPKTGLPEANILKSILPIAGGILGTMLLPGVGTALGTSLFSGAVGAGLAGGLGTFGGGLLAGKSLKDAAIGGLISGGLSGLGAATFGGQSLFGDPITANPGTLGTAGGDIVGPSLNAMPGGGSSIVEGAQLGTFGMPEYAGGADMLTTTGGATGLGSAGDAIASVQNAMNPMVGPPKMLPAFAPIKPDLSAALREDAFGTFGTRAPYPGADLVKSSRAMETFGGQRFHTVPEAPPSWMLGSGRGTSIPAGRVSVEGLKNPANLPLKKGVTDISKTAADRIAGLPEKAGWFDMETFYGGIPEGVSTGDYLKYAAKPIGTQLGIGLGSDLLTSQGAFAPPKYKEPEVPEKRTIPLRGLKFDSTRRGFFPRTEEEALIFAQPGGVRERFFDQRFTVPAKTGGGIAALAFNEGGRSLPSNRVEFGKAAYQDVTDEDESGFGYLEDPENPSRSFVDFGKDIGKAAVGALVPGPVKAAYETLTSQTPVETAMQAAKSAINPATVTKAAISKLGNLPTAYTPVMAIATGLMDATPESQEVAQAIETAQNAMAIESAMAGAHPVTGVEQNVGAYFPGTPVSYGGWAHQPGKAGYETALASLAATDLAKGKELGEPFMGEDPFAAPTATLADIPNPASLALETGAIAAPSVPGFDIGFAEPPGAPTGFDIGAELGMISPVGTPVDISMDVTGAPALASLSASAPPTASPTATLGKDPMDIDISFPDPLAMESEAEVGMGTAFSGLSMDPDFSAAVTNAPATQAAQAAIESAAQLAMEDKQEVGMAPITAALSSFEAINPTLSSLVGYDITAPQFAALQEAEAQAGFWGGWDPKGPPGRPGWGPEPEIDLDMAFSQMDIESGATGHGTGSGAGSGSGAGAGGGPGAGGPSAGGPGSGPDDADPEGGGDYAVGGRVGNIVGMQVGGGVGSDYIDAESNPLGSGTEVDPGTYFSALGNLASSLVPDTLGGLLGAGASTGLRSGLGLSLFGVPGAAIMGAGKLVGMGIDHLIGPPPTTTTPPPASRALPFSPVVGSYDDPNEAATAEAVAAMASMGMDLGDEPEDNPTNPGMAQGIGDIAAAIADAQAATQGNFADTGIVGLDSGVGGGGDAPAGPSNGDPDGGSVDAGDPTGGDAGLIKTGGRVGDIITMERGGPVEMGLGGSIREVIQGELFSPMAKEVEEKGLDSLDDFIQNNPIITGLGMQRDGPTRNFINKMFGIDKLGLGGAGGSPEPTPTPTPTSTPNIEEETAGGLLLTPTELQEMKDINELNQVLAGAPVVRKRGGPVEMGLGGWVGDVLEGGLLSPIMKQIGEDGLASLPEFLQNNPVFSGLGLKITPGMKEWFEGAGGGGGGAAPTPMPTPDTTGTAEGLPPELQELQDINELNQVLAGVPVARKGGGLISSYAMGGAPSPYFEGRVTGRGDGMSDSIPFSIEGQQPAILSRDEYVLPADIVSMMGNGSSDAGSEKIDSFINDFRVQKYGRGQQPPETSRGLRSIV